MARASRHGVGKPGYSEPAIGWNSEDNKSGVIKYGVANYEPRKSVAKIMAPARPALPAPPVPPQENDSINAAADVICSTVDAQRTAVRCVCAQYDIIQYCF